MDKPRHPQVIRPWKIGQIKRRKWGSRPTKEAQWERRQEPPAPKRS